MQSTGILCVAVCFATAVSATRSVAVPVVKKADVGQKAFLGKDSETACTDGPCVKKVDMVLKVNSVLSSAQEVEHKAEEADVEAKQMVETVAKVKAAKKEESASKAEEVAAEEKVKIVKEEVDNEETEIKEKEQVVAKEKEEAKKVVSPAAKKVVKKDEDEMADEIKEEQIEAEMKKEEEKTVKSKAQIVKMKAVTSKANVAAKEEEFKAEDKAVTKSEKLFDPKAIFKVEIAVYNVQKAVVKEAKKAPPPGTPAKDSDEIKKAELPKINLAVQVINTAKVEAEETKTVQKKAEEQIKEVEAEAKTEEATDKITAKFGSVKDLEDKIKECKPCGAAPSMDVTTGKGKEEDKSCECIPCGTPTPKRFPSRDRKSVV